MMTRLTTTALNTLAMMPIMSVSAMPWTGSVPNCYRITPVMNAVRFASKVAPLNARV